MMDGTTQPSVAWRAGALVYSGRPDPNAQQVDGLMALWNRMAAASAWNEPPSRLGYRGCWLAAPDGRRWMAFDGAVACYAPRQRPGGPSERHPGPIEVRRDAGRAFERALLATAPAGTSLPRV
jgi:hypothetical protein